MAAAKGTKSGARAGARSSGKGGKGANKVPPTRATGVETATGTALAEPPRIKGKERGSQTQIVGGEPKPDALNGAKPRGAQKEPAEFSSNGQVEHATVGTSAGPIPVSVVAKDQKDADRITEDNRRRAEAAAAKGGDRILDEATVNRLGRPEISAIAHQRGYELPDGGGRVTRAAFLAAQGKDKNLKK